MSDVLEVSIFTLVLVVFDTIMILGSIFFSKEVIEKVVREFGKIEKMIKELKEKEEKENG